MTTTRTTRRTRRHCFNCDLAEVIRDPGVFPREVFCLRTALDMGMEPYIQSLHDVCDEWAPRETSPSDFDLLASLDAPGRPATQGEETMTAKQAKTPRLCIAQEQIGPQRAASLLEKNHTNRPLRPSKVADYVREITRAQWKLSPSDMICISPEGALLNGQHRLTAVVQTGVPQPFIVHYNVDPGLFAIIDTGARRTAGDVLAITGESNCRNLAAAARLLGHYLDQDLEGRYAPSNADILKILADHPGLRASVKTVKNISHLGTPRVLAVAHYLFGLMDTEAADQFFEDLRTGANLGKNDPALRLRERLLKNMGSREKLDAKYIFAITIKAWNALREGKSVVTLKWAQNGSNKEPFPEVV